MTSKAQWLKEAESETTIDIETVVVDQFGLVYHDPEKLESHWDMQEKHIDEASDEASPCSDCFPILHSFEQTHFKTSIPV